MSGMTDHQDHQIDSGDQRQQEEEIPYRAGSVTSLVGDPEASHPGIGEEQKVQSATQTGIIRKMKAASAEGVERVAGEGSEAEEAERSGIEAQQQGAQAV